jgi:hypothetical protein
MLGINYTERPLDEGFDGALIRVGDNTGIIINSNLHYNSRKRFTIAHEIGHCFIPSHQAKSEFFCEGTNISAFDSKKELYEYEADVFASEFLMPSILFIKDSSKLLPSISSFSTLADKYKTSLTSAALRYLEFTPEPCAIVLMQNGNIRWKRRSSSFKYDIKNRIEDCCTYDMIKSNGEYISDELYAHHWLVNPNIDYICEESVNMFNFHQQLIVLKLNTNNDYSDIEPDDTISY